MTDWDIATLIGELTASMTPLHLIEIWWTLVQWPRSSRGYNVYSLRQSSTRVSLTTFAMGRHC